MLLISHNIGDPSETLPKPLWVKGSTYIIKPPKNKIVPEVWSFRCTHGENVSAFEWTRTERPGRAIRQNLHAKLVLNINDETTYQAVYRHTVAAAGNALKKQLQQLKSDDMKQSDLSSIRDRIWQYSKTGGVDPTNFKQNEKGSVARFLAKMVEGGEVVEIKSVSATSVMLNSFSDGQ